MRSSPRHGCVTLPWIATEADRTMAAATVVKMVLEVVVQAVVEMVVAEVVVELVVSVGVAGVIVRVGHRTAASRSCRKSSLHNGRHSPLRR